MNFFFLFLCAAVFSKSISCQGVKHIPLPHTYTVSLKLWTHGSSQIDESSEKTPPWEPSATRAAGQPRQAGPTFLLDYL